MRPPRDARKTLKARHARVVEIEADLSLRGAARLADQVEATLAAMRAGVDIVYQATLRDGELIGHADFLRRVPGASALGDWHYEVLDTKLARRPQAKFLVQLAFYSRLLARAQGLEPVSTWVVTGDAARTEHPFRVADARHYVDRQLRALQHQRKQDGVLRHALLPADPDARLGFQRLPAPDAHDLYFDMEGDPLETDGLEYLFGVAGRGIDPTRPKEPAFRAFWAQDRREERLAFEAFVDAVTAHLAAQGGVRPAAGACRVHREPTTRARRARPCRAAACGPARAALPRRARRREAAHPRRHSHRRPVQRAGRAAEVAPAARRTRRHRRPVPGPSCTAATG